MLFTKCEGIELVVPDVQANTLGVRIPFPSQSNLQNKFIKKIVLATNAQTQRNNDSLSPSGNVLISTMMSESMWLCLQTSYDAYSGTNNQGVNLNNIQLSLFAATRTINSQYATVTMIDIIPEFDRVLVNWEKSFLIVNFRNDDYGNQANGRSVFLNVFYEDMYTSQATPITQPTDTLMNQSTQLEQEIKYLKSQLMNLQNGRR